MKQSLQEEISRIHKLTYGQSNLNEQVLSDIFKNIISQETKIDDPKKADLVTDDVKEFFNTLELSSTSGGLKEQKYGYMTFQKAVESMQIGLQLLGYDLPIHGVDGLYGPETSNAVKKFAEEKLNVKNGTATPDVLNKLIELLKQKGINSSDLKSNIDTVTTGGGEKFTDLDLTTDLGFKIYSEICQKYIDRNPPNQLGITGDMMAKSAKNAFIKYKKYVPPELALSQLILEGGIRNKNERSRPIRTKNPFNVGNVDSGANRFFQDVQSAIDVYYDLIAKNYLGAGKTAQDLMNNFVNKRGNRYASGYDYERKLNQLANQVNAIASPILAKHKISKTSDMA